MPLRISALFSILGLALTLGCPDVSDVPYTDPSLVADDGDGLEEGDIPGSGGADTTEATPSD
ncbi:MAG: hypothetical protein AAF219_05095 [Myxococcota bacterium]